MTNNVLIRPIITEKMHSHQEATNSYAFQVSVNSNKLEIKKAIEERFSVRVKKVRTMNFKGKKRSLSVRS